MPDDALKSFGVRCNRGIIYYRNYNTAVGNPGGVTTVFTDNSQYFGVYLFSIFQRADQIDTDILFLVPSADGKNKRPRLLN